MESEIRKCCEDGCENEVGERSNICQSCLEKLLADTEVFDN